MRGLEVAVHYCLNPTARLGTAFSRGRIHHYIFPFILREIYIFPFFHIVRNLYIPFHIVRNLYISLHVVRNQFIVLNVVRNLYMHVTLLYIQMQKTLFSNKFNFNKT